MKTEILISCDDWENRVAVLEEGALAEIYFEREEKVIGSIYKGRVENVLPGMGACFVNIGLGRNAFLYVDDIMRDPINVGETEFTDRRRGRTVNELLRVGDEILVQIVKEPRGLKGARVSTNISLPGRYLVLMPTGRYSGVSSKIEDEGERDRLKQIMRDIRPEGMATIVRTAGRGVSKAELIADLGVQLRLWHNMLESYNRASAPALVHKDLNLIFKAVRDFMTSDVHQVVIDSKEQYDEIRGTMSYLGPQYLTRLKLWQGPGNLFAVRGIDEELQKLLKPKIMLPSGGYLVLEHTEALTVIDVNTGKFTGGRNLEDTLVRTNVEGAAEVARQVRLRDIGGIIVVDFIDMAHEYSRAQVIDTLTEALKRDRTRSTIQSFSNLGLLEFTRKRVGKDLAGQLRSECPYCGGMGDVMSSESLAIGLLRQIRQRGIDGERGKTLVGFVDPSVGTQLVGWYREEFEKVAKTYALELALFVEPHRHRENVTLEAAPRPPRTIAVGTEVEAELLPVRMPDPASGVAVIDGTLVEVRDGANGSGQRVKIKVSSVNGNLARAELAEPLKTGQSRRRRGRGRGKGTPEGEAPIAPPAPVPVTAAANGDRTRVAQHPAAPGRPPGRRDTTEIPFGFDEQDERDFPERSGRVAGNVRGLRERPTSRSPAARTEESHSERGPQGRTPRSRRTGLANPSSPAPLVVGGEGDIDYDDGDDDAPVRPPRGRAASTTAAERTPAVRARSSAISGPNGGDTGEVPHRRRRRGRGRSSETTPTVVDRDDDDDLTVVTGPGAQSEMPTRRVRPAPTSARSSGERQKPYGAPHETGYGESRSGQSSRDAEHLAPQSRTAHPSSPKVYGPIQQIYGRPVRPQPDEAPARKPVRSRPPIPADDADDLEVMIEADEPAVLDVDIRPPSPAGRRSGARVQSPVATEPSYDQPPSRMAHKERPRLQAERPSEVPALPAKPPAPKRPTRRPARSFEEPADGETPGDIAPAAKPNDESGARSRAFSRPRTGSPAMTGRRPTRQVYPPPGAEEDAAPQVGPKAPPMNAHRKPRGPMMREPGSPPPPKGKVRQLYPPPPVDAVFETSAGSEPTAEPRSSGGSMFVSDAQERDERRQRARDRAENRRPTADAQPEAEEE
ncbi:MAG: Rne/Rng family ribonuclease [Candidatus Eremiobacteraeota bacterium]|nr:Rne/Rng family ribonuclease [Candidatus Eremiobacteraeota bacterium]MBC5827916.1 Rne/Rng family ribonuclease [Candidatus Eremiobacteraeota bacterium]